MTFFADLFIPLQNYSTFRLLHMRKLSLLIIFNQYLTNSIKTFLKRRLHTAQALHTHSHYQQHAFLREGFTSPKKLGQIFDRKHVFRDNSFKMKYIKILPEYFLIEHLEIYQKSLLNFYVSITVNEI